MVSQKQREVNDPDAKQRILDAAADIFAAKGFDGARVDEIAKAATVNKALIYYYFKSKDELLEVLFDHSLEAIFSYLSAEVGGSVNSMDGNTIKKALTQYLDVLEEHENVIRVMLMESLKRTADNSLIFSLIKKTLNRMYNLGNEMGIDIKQEAHTEIMEFFTGVMPVLNYVVYHNLWKEKLNITEMELRNRFLDSFIGTHVAYSLKIYQIQMEGRP